MATADRPPAFQYSCSLPEFSFGQSDRLCIGCIGSTTLRYGMARRKYSEVFHRHCPCCWRGRLGRVSACLCLCYCLCLCLCLSLRLCFLFYVYIYVHAHVHVHVYVYFYVNVDPMLGFPACILKICHPSKDTMVTFSSASARSLRTLSHERIPAKVRSVSLRLREVA